MTNNTDPVRAHDELRAQAALLRTPEFMARFNPEKFAGQLERIADALSRQPTACRCVDCGGDHHVHDSHCAYMLEIHGDPQPVAGECSLTWKASTTPAGRPLSRLVPSTRPTDGTASGLWPTPTTRDHKDSIGMSFEPRKDGASRLDLLPRQVYWIAQNTPSALWPTPQASDDRGPSKGWDSAAARHAANGTHKQMGLRDLVPRIGAGPYGFSATTGKPGALNPEFVCWLMGFPAEWLLCAPASKAEPRTRKRSTGTAAAAR